MRNSFNSNPTVLDNCQTAAQCRAVHSIVLLLISSHPSGQRDPCGHSDFYHRVSVFFSANAERAIWEGSDGRLIFINIFVSTPRYVAGVVLFTGTRRASAMIKLGLRFIGEVDGK